MGRGEPLHNSHGDKEVRVGEESHHAHVCMYLLNKLLGIEIRHTVAKWNVSLPE